MNSASEEIKGILKKYYMCLMRMHYPLATDRRSELKEELDRSYVAVSYLKDNGYVFEECSEFGGKIMLGSEVVCEYTLPVNEISRRLISCILVSDLCDGFVNDISGKQIAVLNVPVLKSIDFSINAMSGSLEFSINGSDVDASWVSSNVVQGGRILRCLNGLVKCGIEAMSIGFVRVVGRRRYIVSYIGID